VIFYRNLLGLGYEKILLMNTLLFRRDYRALKPPEHDAKKETGKFIDRDIFTRFDGLPEDRGGSIFIADTPLYTQ